MTTDIDYDIIIIGAGMVGLTAALALCESQLRIAIVDKHRPMALSKVEHLEQRVSAIAPASLNIFNSLHAWHEMKSLRVSPYREMFVWEANNSGNIHFDSADVGAATLGYIIENNVIQSALLSQLDKYSVVNWLCPEAIRDVQLLDKIALITLETGRQLSCKLLIGADGAVSTVRDLVGIKTTEWEYEHTSLVATVQTEHVHKETAWQIFLPTGPLAFLPLANKHHCSIVWSTNPDQAKNLQEVDPAEFEQQLTAAFENKLGKIKLLNERHLFPLKMRHAKQYTLNRLALIGDAAHSIHPLAGQGVNLGILDAACLAEIIVAAKMKNRDFGAHYNLRRYERWRKGGNLTMISAVELFKRLFGIQMPPIKWLRNSGLKMMDKSTLIKSCIMQQAMGLKGDLPQLARIRN